MFNRHGFEAVSIDQIMANAGLTRGGFYHHFANKEELYSEAIAGYAGCNATAMDFGAPAGRIVLQMVNAYLSRQHLEDVELHCPMIALPSDVARAGAVVRRTYERQLTGMVGLFEGGNRSRRLATHGRARWRWRRSVSAAWCWRARSRTPPGRGNSRGGARARPRHRRHLMARAVQSDRVRQIEADGADQDHRDEQRASGLAASWNQRMLDQRDQAAQRPIPRQRSFRRRRPVFRDCGAGSGRRLGLLGLTARRQRCSPALAARYSRATERSSSQCQSAPRVQQNGLYLRINRPLRRVIRPRLCRKSDRGHGRQQEMAGHGFTSS